MTPDQQVKQLRRQVVVKTAIGLGLWLLAGVAAARSDRPLSFLKFLGAGSLASTGWRLVSGVHRDQARLLLAEAARVQSLQQGDA